MKSVQFCGKQAGKSAAAQEQIQSGGLQQSSGEQCPAKSVAPREQAVQDPAMKPVICCDLCCGGLLHFDAEGFQQSSVLDTTGAGCFATSAIEARIEVVLDSGRELQSAVDNGAHQVDASPGAIIFVSSFDVCGTGGGAQSTVNTVEKSIIGDRQIGRAHV